MSVPYPPGGEPPPLKEHGTKQPDRKWHHTPCKEHVTRQPDRKWHHTSPREQTNRCKNITFPKLRWRSVTRGHFSWIPTAHLADSTGYIQGPHPLRHVDRQTTENITYPQLLWRAVTNNNCNIHSIDFIHSENSFFFKLTLASVKYSIKTSSWKKYVCSNLLCAIFGHISRN